MHKAKANKYYLTDDSGMSVIVKTVTRLTVGIIFLYGVYIVLKGHLIPGGGVAGGILVAMSFVNLILAFGRKIIKRKINIKRSFFMVILGLSILLLISFLGQNCGYFFLNYFIDKGLPYDFCSGGTIPLANLAIALIVAAGFFAMFDMLVLSHQKEKRK